MLNQTKHKEISHTWHLVDAKNEILGKVAAKIALALVGKNKTYFTRHLDCGDYVVVINAANVKTTGKKTANKIYTRYSGYPNGLRKETLGDKMTTNPAEVIQLAVKGMLPNNKLRDVWLTRLFIFKDNTHPYMDKLK